MNVDEHVKQLQVKLNEFTSRFLDGLSPIGEDGITGAATEARIKLVKLFLGYSDPARVSHARLLNAMAHVTTVAGRLVNRGPELAAGNPRGRPTAGAVDSPVARPSDGLATAPITNRRGRAGGRALASVSGTRKDKGGPRAARWSKAARRGVVCGLVGVIVAATGSAAVFPAPASAAPYTVTLTTDGYSLLRPVALSVPLSHTVTFTATANGSVGQRISSIRYIALYDTGSSVPIKVCYWGTVCSAPVTGDHYGAATYVAYVGESSGAQATVLATSNAVMVWWIPG
jgi:hypothetical protein